MTLVRQDELLRKRYELLVSIPGIAQVSAMQLLAELSTLPSDLTVREWVPLRSPRKGLLRKSPGSKQSPSTGTHCCCEEVAPRHIRDISKRSDV
jgi:hypothetical protein